MKVSFAHRKVLMKISRHRYRGSRALLAAMLFLACAQSARANAWTNPGLGDWFINSNWNAGGPPFAGEFSYIENGGTALISTGGATSGNLYLGTFTVSGGNGTLLVAAPGTADYNLTSGSIYLGKVYDKAAPSLITGTLHVSKGAFVRTTGVPPAEQYSIVIGDSRDGGSAANGVVTVTGTGSFLNGYPRPLAIGLGNATGSLVCDDHGTFLSIGANISHGSVTAKNKGIFYCVDAGLFLGFGGATNSSIDIFTGGVVQAPSMQLYNGLVRVDNGSTTVAGLRIEKTGGSETATASNGQLVVGDHAAGRMDIAAGGLLNTYRGYMGGSSDGVGVAMVAGRWKASGSIWVGNAGNGTLNVLNGGTLTSAGNGYLGYENTAVGYAAVDGPNSAWTMAASLFIGGTGLAPGGSGQLLIRNGGRVNAASVTLYNTGVLALGANASLGGPFTALGGTLDTINNITFPNSFTLGTGGLIVRTNGYNSTFSGALSGSGGLTKTGSFTGSGPGTLTLTGNSTYSGPTTVSFGKLVVTGNISSSVTVSNSSVLSGNGAVGGIIATGSGIVAPGNSTGVLTVNGNYTQESGGVLNIEIGGPAPGSGYDRIALSGKATIAGTLNLSLVNGYKPTVGQTFAIITSISESGNFSTINSSGFTVRSDASANGIVLTVTSVVPGAPVITSATSASGVQDHPFSYQITATESPTSFGATALPPGLSVNPASGVISGLPTTVGSYNPVISATNSTATGSATLNITISAPTPAPTRLANISTRLRVETDDNVLFGGFIITGTQAKKLIVRAIGPSVSVPGSLDDPTLELYSGSTLIASNDNWLDSPEKQAIIDSTIPPANNLESAIVRTLAPGSYTTIVRGVNQGTGVGLVEIYDLDGTVDSKLAQISTRGFVQTGDNAMFGGLYVVGGSSQKVIVRAIGPSLPLLDKLADPTLELYDGNGASLGANDNWRTGEQETEIIATTVPPSDDLESAIVRTLTPGPYTAIVRGANNTTGIALVEVYALP